MSTTQSPFSSSTTVFIEYHDIIKSPWLLMLYSEHNEDAMAHSINTDEIKYLDNAGLYEWYKYRKERNPLKELDVDKVYSDEDIENLLYAVMDASTDFYTNSEPLEFVGALRFMVTQKLSNQIIIYSERYEAGIEKDLRTDHNLVNLGLEYMHGNFEDIVKKLSMDCTYVLSDINKLQMLSEYGRLQCSSVLMASDYRYNYSDMMKTPKVSVENILRTSVIKYNTFIANKPSPNLVYDYRKEILDRY